MTPEQRSTRGRIGAYAALARNDPRALNVKARQVYRDSFREGHECVLCPRFAMPAGLPDAEVTRRAEALRKGHFLRLAQKSARTRTARARR